MQVQTSNGVKYVFLDQKDSIYFCCPCIFYLKEINNIGKFTYNNVEGMRQNLVQFMQC